MSRYVFVDEKPEQSGRYVFVDDKPAVVKAGSAINDVGRQIGLTARYGIEGLANTAQIVTEPLRYLQDKLTPGEANTKPLGMVASQFADRIGLPTPRDANERVVGDATRLMAGAGGVVRGAQAASNVVGGVAQKVLTSMAANPTAQLTAAAGGGVAGGSSREAGGSSGQQMLSSLLGTVVGGLTPGAIGSVAQRVNAMRATPLQLDGKITLALQDAGVDFGQLPKNIKDSLRADMRRAMASGEEINPDALRRLADFRATGTTPTRGALTLDPVQISKEQNLAKMGANSADGGLQGLARLQNQNNAQLIDNLNRLGAAEGNVDDAGRLVTSAITGKQQGLRSAEQSAWDAAKSSPGYKQPISAGVISDVNQALGDEGLMPFMNPTISKYLEAFQTGQPFTPQAYRNVQSMLAREVAKGGNEGAAANLAKRVLERSDLRPAGFADASNSLATQGMAGAMRQADDGATSAIDAVNRARSATRAAYQYEDSSPLVRSVLSDGASADPQRIATRFVVNGTTDEARTLANEIGPQGLGTIKNALLSHLKNKALNGADDEVGKFSQSAFNKALKDIGEDKLRIFFSPEEIAKIQANARAASYMQAQPVGSAVNNSNSGALLASKVSDWLSFMPVVGPLAAPSIRSMGLTLGQRQAQNVAPSLLRPTPMQLAPGLLGPGIAAGGLLAAPGPERP